MAKSAIAYPQPVLSTILSPTWFPESLSLRARSRTGRPATLCAGWPEPSWTSPRARSRFSAPSERQRERQKQKPRTRNFKKKISLSQRARVFVIMPGPTRALYRTASHSGWAVLSNSNANANAPLVVAIEKATPFGWLRVRRQDSRALTKLLLCGVSGGGLRR